MEFELNRNNINLECSICEKCQDCCLRREIMNITDSNHVMCSKCFNEYNKSKKIIKLIMDEKDNLLFIPEKKNNGVY